MANWAGSTDRTGTRGGDIFFAEALAGRDRVSLSGRAGDDVLFAGHTPVFVDAGAGNVFYDSALNLDDPSKWTIGDDGLASNPALPHATLLATGADEEDWFSLTLTKKTEVTFDVTVTNTGGDGSQPWPGQYENNVFFHTYWNHHAGDAWAGSNTVTLPKGLQHFSVFAAGVEGFVVPAGWAYVVTISTKHHASSAPVPVTGDDLSGGAGHDMLFGSAGADQLSGGAGADDLIGGAGADVFVLQLPANSTLSDTVADFASGEDRIALELGHAYHQNGRRLDPSAFHLGTEAGDTDDRIIYDPDSGTLLFDADGTGSEAAVRLAVFSNHAALSADDFVVKGAGPDAAGSGFALNMHFDLQPLLALA